MGSPHLLFYPNVQWRLFTGQEQAISDDRLFFARLLLDGVSSQDAV